MIRLTPDHIKPALILGGALTIVCGLIFGFYERAPAPKVPKEGKAGYLVQILSRQNEAEAQAAFSALQIKFASLLASRAPLIKRADLGDKGIYYRAMIGPFDNPAEASLFCGDLKAAGGQCLIQRDH
jgi:hypothetical protein